MTESGSGSPESSYSEGNGSGSDSDTRASPHRPEEGGKEWELRRKAWVSLVGPPLHRPTAVRDFENCPVLAPTEGPERGLRPQKNFIAVFVPQLSRVDICSSSVPGSEAVYYVKELTPFIVDNQGPLLRDKKIPPLAEQGHLLAWHIVDILVRYGLGFLSNRKVQLYKCDYERDLRTDDIGP